MAENEFWIKMEDLVKMHTNQKRKNISGMRTIGGFLLAILALSISPVEGTGGEFIDGWGLQMLILALGLCGIFFLVREKSREKCPMIKAVSAVSALFTVLGQSYMQAQSWEPLFAGGLQVARTLVLWGGV